MKILIYSDLHISRTSSIMPLGEDSKYTYRQKMIIELGKYLEELIDIEKPDLIINCGDTFDKNTITSYDIEVASEFFKCFRMSTVPHLVLVGNHEMVNQTYNAVKLLGNINNITVITDPCTVDPKLFTNANEDIKLAFLPYCNYNDIIEFPEGDFLFSHQDIQGSLLRGDFRLPSGIEPSILKDKYKLVFNGHIHKPSIENNIINVGSVTTHSFSDDNEATPQCYIFDTNTLDLKTFKPTCCPLFRKFTIKNNISELTDYLNILNKNYKYILHIICPFELKEMVKEIINNNSNIIANRLNVVIDKEETNIDNNETININLKTNIDINQTFKEFIDTINLNYPKEYYLKVLEGIDI